MSKKSPESFYNINKLHFVFAILALTLLGLLGAVFMKDWIKPWKDYQRAYRQIDIENARIKLDEAQKSLDGDSDYAALAEELDLAQSDFEAQCMDQDYLLEIKDLETQRAIVDKEFKAVKAKVDAVKYQYEKKSYDKDGVDEALKMKYEVLAEKKANYISRLEDFDTKIATLKERDEECGRKVKDLERQKRRVEKYVSLYQRKLDKIDPAEMSFLNQIADMVRDLPVIDLANPNYKIEQIVIKDIHDDLNFKLVPKVERCLTCHKGIAKEDFKNAQQPLRAHPNLDLFVGVNSPHSLEEFGCTVCHGGRGRGTSFNSAVHVPSSEKQKKEWEKKYDYHKMHHWDEPMLPLNYTEASCFKCHSGEGWVPQAEKLNMGLQLIEQSGCYGCHEIEKYEDWPKQGPTLVHLSSKVSKPWAYKWIKDPQHFRHNALMPAYFGQMNNDDPESVRRTDQEIHAMVEYLFSESTKFDMAPMPKLKGNAANGQELVKSIGCYACHQEQDEPTNELEDEHSLRQQFGPNLIHLGSKVSKEWMFNWLKNPSKYHPETRMPDLRLTDQEAVDIATHLVKDKNPAFDSEGVTPYSDEEINQILLSFYTSGLTEKQAREKIESMNKQEKLYDAGKRLIGHYGCYSCHDIKGFEDAKPIGAVLTHEGSKDIHKFDFGFVHIDHSKHAWIYNKIKNPRLFDSGKNLKPLEKSRMPNFNFTDQEAEAVTTAVLGFVETHTVEKKIVPQTPDQVMIQEGQKIVKQFNCQGCHVMENNGGTIMESVKNWLIEYEGKSPDKAEDLALSFTAPNLQGEGKRVYAQWLFNFLHAPETIRQNLELRMPTYGFNSAHLNALVKYFYALDNETFPFDSPVDESLTQEELDAARKLISDDYFACSQCHFIDGKKPTGEPETWAPNFTGVEGRLQPDWLTEWLKNPQALIPGTKMPAFYDPDPENFPHSGPDDILDGDENEQIRVMRNYLMNISQYEENK